MRRKSKCITSLLQQRESSVYICAGWLTGIAAACIAWFLRVFSMAWILSVSCGRKRLKHDNGRIRTRTRTRTHTRTHNLLFVALKERLYKRPFDDPAPSYHKFSKPQPWSSSRVQADEDTVASDVKKKLCSEVDVWGLCIFSSQLSAAMHFIHCTDIYQNWPCAT